MGDLGPKVGWSLSADFASASVGPRDAFMTIRFHPQVNVRFGQFYPTFGLERLTSTSRLEIIDRTRMTDRITYERNPGVAILNAQPYKRWISYSLGAWNGPGMNQADNNDAKDVVGRVAITPPAVPGLSIAINGASGRQPEGDRTRSGIDVSLDRGPFRIAVEGLRERFDGVADREGFYLLGVYRVLPRRPSPNFRMAELAARYVSFRDPIAARPATPTRSAVPETTEEFQFGGNYYVNRNVRFMANAIVPVDGRVAPGSTVIGRLQVIF